MYGVLQLCVLKSCRSVGPTGPVGDAEPKIFDLGRGGGGGVWGVVVLVVVGPTPPHPGGEGGGGTCLPLHVSHCTFPSLLHCNTLLLVSATGSATFFLITGSAQLRGAQLLHSRRQQLI